MKINKKGFTLIELLAVIAILAILVVIAVPAVLDLFSGAQEDSFITQAQSLYKSAEQKYLRTQLRPGGVNVFCSKGVDGASTATTDVLDTQGTKAVKYNIVFTNGKVTTFTVRDKDRSISLTDETGIDISDIDLNSPGYKDSGTLDDVTACPVTP